MILFLMILPFMAGFAYFLPNGFKVFYWTFMPIIFTMFPALVLHVACGIFGGGIPFLVCFILALFFVGLPLSKAFAPSRSAEEE